MNNHLGFFTKHLAKEQSPEEKRLCYIDSANREIALAAKALVYLSQLREHKNGRQAHEMVSELMSDLTRDVEQAERPTAELDQ